MRPALVYSLPLNETRSFNPTTLATYSMCRAVKRRRHQRCKTFQCKPNQVNTYIYIYVNNNISLTCHYATTLAMRNRTSSCGLPKLTGQEWTRRKCPYLAALHISLSFRVTLISLQVLTVCKAVPSNTTKTEHVVVWFVSLLLLYHSSSILIWLLFCKICQPQPGSGFG